MENKKKIKVELIAELAQGYEGSIKIAKMLIDAASKATADSVKFQLVFADEISTNNYKDYNIFKSLELSLKNWKLIREYAKKKKLKFYVDIFGVKSLEFAKKIHSDGIKLHPTDLNNYELLKKIQTLKFKKIFIGIGGASKYELLMLLKNLRLKSQVILLLGFQSYPTPISTNQISRINFINKMIYKKNIALGFADHSLPKTKYNNIPIIVSIGAGARYIEKHLTIPFHRNLEDYESAYFPKEFINLKNEITHACMSLGRKDSFENKNFYLSKEEKNYKKKVQRSYVSLKNKKKGDKIIKKDFIFIRSPEKRPLLNFSSAMNKKLKKNININETLTMKHIK